MGCKLLNFKGDGLSTVPLLFNKILRQENDL